MNKEFWIGESPSMEGAFCEWAPTPLDAITAFTEGSSRDDDDWDDCDQFICRWFVSDDRGATWTHWIEQKGRPCRQCDGCDWCDGGEGDDE